jgi:hypothetical protein
MVGTVADFAGRSQTCYQHPCVSVTSSGTISYSYCTCMFLKSSDLHCLDWSLGDSNPESPEPLPWISMLRNRWATIISIHVVPTEARCDLPRGVNRAFLPRDPCRRQNHGSYIFAENPEDRKKRSHDEGPFTPSVLVEKADKVVIAGQIATHRDFRM